MEDFQFDLPEGGKRLVPVVEAFQRHAFDVGNKSVEELEMYRDTIQGMFLMFESAILMSEEPEGVKQAVWNFTRLILPPVDGDEDSWSGSPVVQAALLSGFVALTTPRVTHE